MEFFKIVDAKTTVDKINELLSFENIENISNQLFELGPHTKDKMPVGTLWGEFTLYRHPINGGVRFALMECPNAFVWTITTGYPPQRDSVIIHLTINRTQKAEKFITEIEEFLEDHANCLKNVLSLPGS